MLKKKEYRMCSPDKKTEYIDIEIHRDGRYGAPGLRRRDKKRPTPEQVKKHNLRMKEKKIWRYLRSNFTPGDLWLTFTYRRESRPEEIETAKKDIQKLTRRIRRYAAKRGIEAKYMYSIEIGSRGGVHCHMVLNRIPDVDRLLTEVWSNGHVHITPMYSDNHFRNLAEYLAKADIYSHSRNLIYPVESSKKLKQKSFSSEPKAYKGFTVIKDSVEEGINIYSGLPYMHYTMVRFRRD